MTEFEFTDDKNLAVFTCSHVLKDKNPILFVSHDVDGDWQFLCGSNAHTEQNVKVISLVEVVGIDPTLSDLFEMPIGVGAEREKVGAKWNPFRL